MHAGDFFACSESALSLEVLRRLMQPRTPRVVMSTTRVAAAHQTLIVTLSTQGIASC